MEVLQFSIKLYREEIGKKYPTARVWFTTPDGDNLTTEPLGFEKFPETAEDWFALVKEIVDDVSHFHKLYKEP